MNIIFEHPTVQKNISSTEIHIENFKGHNVGSPQTIKSVTTSCPCTTVKYPKELISGQFEIEVSIDKRGKSGFFSQSVTLLFSSGKEYKLNINGKII